jgi:hypothetical protein
MHVAARIRGADGHCAVHKKAATLIRKYPKAVVSMKTYAIGLLPLAATPLAATKLESWPTGNECYGVSKHDRLLSAELTRVRSQSGITFDRHPEHTFCV